MNSLHETERWMMSVLTHPQGVMAGTESLEGDARLATSADELNRIVHETESWCAIDRLGVYWNAYFARLTECLREDFPVLRQTLGDETFDTFMLDYLQAHPPASYTLGRLGVNLSCYLRESRPDRTDSTPDWADFLAELAEFEWLISEVFDGPGDEESSSIPIRSDEPDHQGECFVICSPSLRLAEFQFPVAMYHAAVKAGTIKTIPKPEPSWVAIVRDNFVVKHFLLSQDEFHLLTRFKNGQSLLAAFEDEISKTSLVADVIDETWISSHFARWRRCDFILGTTPVRPTEPHEC